MTPAESAKEYCLAFIALNPSVAPNGYNFKWEPIGMMNYFKQLLVDQAIRGGTALKAPPSASTETVATAPVVVPAPVPAEIVSIPDAVRVSLIEINEKLKSILNQLELIVLAMK